MQEDLIVGHVTLTHGFEFHLAPATTPDRALCGAAVTPTQIPPMFWGVDAAIEGRWCERCERAARAAARAAIREPETVGDAPCV
ncbi:MAG: hypothetical protein MUF30_04115 [Burkholderiales bacterium]|jgi:hypothetical protein|nr:hypothetical protein [Burkholderiales bacterium]